MMKRCFAVLLCMAMLFVLMPTTIASAAENNAQQVAAEGGSKTSEDGNITISKTITPTEKENYFDITLTVTDKDIIDETSTDVVLVLDVSNTMNYDPDKETDDNGNVTSNGPEPTRFERARAAAAAFVEHYYADPDLGTQRRLGLVTFNTDAKVEIQLANPSRMMMNQVNSLSMPNYDDADTYRYKRFTNIEGGLKQAQDMLAISNAKNKFIILITDGFPTTYVESQASDGAYLGYDTYVTSRFKDRQLNKPCTYGVSYSDEAAARAQTAAAAIKKSGTNIVSIGIDIGGQTIQKYIDQTEKSGFAVVDRPSGVHPNNYVIGNATDASSYSNWLGTGIGGGSAVTTGYYKGDNTSELSAAFDEILETVKSTVYRAMTDPLVVDPMGTHAEFLGFYNREGQVVGSLDGSHTEGGENTANYGTAINWKVDESGYTIKTVQDDLGRNVVEYTYTLKYRVRLENELVDFVEEQNYLTNDDAQLEYTPPDEDPDDGETPPDETLPFPDPEVKGYLGELSFHKTDAEEKPLAGAEFTLSHNSDCSVCEGKVAIHDQVVTSDANGLVSFQRIPSGHEYTLTETKSPDGYQSNDTAHKVVVSYGTVTVDGKTSFATVVNTPVTPATWQITGTKAADEGIPLEGHTFRITNLDRVSVDVKSDAQGVITFPKQTFTAAGEYGFEIKEVPGTESNVVYDSTIYYVLVNVVQDGNAYKVASYTIRNSATGKYLDLENGEGITFHNTKRTPAEVNLMATKTITGDDRKAAAGEFQFVLKDAYGEVLQTKTNTELLENNITFDKLTFGAVGTYTYTISEVIPAEGEAYMTYDETVYTVTVVVTAQEDSDALTAAVTYQVGEESKDAVLFTNKLEDSGDADFSFTKYAQDEDGNEKVLPGATFVLTHQQCEGCTEDIADKTAASDKDGIVTFKNILSGHMYILTEKTDAGEDTITIGDVTYQPAYYRNVVVKFGKVYIDGVEAKEASTVKIINIPTRAARVVLEGVKTVENAVVYDNAYHFELQEYVYNKDSGEYAPAELKLTETNISSANDQGEVASRIVFDPLLFEDVGTHYYKISENAGTEPGMIYDSTAYYVVVDVSADDAGENLAAHVKVSTESFAAAEKATPVAADEYGSVVFTGINFNNILRTPTNAQLQAKKALNSGKDALTAGEFTFLLKDSQGNILEEVKNAADGSVIFSSIAYDTAGTYTYTISEKTASGDRVTYDTKEVKVTVAVTENDGSSYTAVVQYDGSTEIPAFTNAYRGQLIVVKQNESGAAVSGAQFTLTHKDGCCEETVAAMTAVSREGDGHVLFANIPSGHTYVLSETGVPSGYVQAPDHIVEVAKGVVTIKELDGGEAELNDHSQHVITNYPAVTIYGDKVLVGRNLAEGEFQFTITETDENHESLAGGYTQTVANDASGFFTFELPYDKEDAGKTFYYTVTEAGGTLAGVTYSDAHYYVTVTLDRDMKATVTYDDAVAQESNEPQAQAEVSGMVFTNTYDAEDVDVTFSGKKTLTGRDLREHEFLFELYSTDSSYTVSEGAAPIQSVHNNADGTYSFAAISYRGAGTYHYVIREFQGALGGITYDATVYKVEVTVTDDTENGKLVAVVKVNGTEAGTSEFNFNNTYTINGETDAVISGTKTLVGRALAEEEFYFHLLNSDGDVVETVTNDASGKFTFNKLTFDAIGTYTYQVKEVPGTEETMAYDGSVYKVVIDVYDNGVGGLGSSIRYILNDAGAESIHFTNEFTTPGQMILGGTKTFNGETPSESYVFQLIRATDGVLIDEVQSDADGKFYFKPVPYTSAGTYQYRVVERKGEKTDVIYDSTVYYVTAEVTKEGTEYVVETTIRNSTTNEPAESIAFNNTYRDPAVAQLKARKTLEGKTLADGEFTFELRNITDDETGILVERVTNDKDGNVTFRRLTFNQAGTYRYRIDEIGTTVVSEDAPYMVYDETVYEVEIVVAAPEDTATDDPFVVKSLTYYNGEADADAPVEFKNKYVDTGDAQFSFTKLAEYTENGETKTKPLSGVKFTLTHAQCECDAEIAAQEAVSNENGVVSFADIPSGHYYILSEVDDGNDGNITVNGTTYKTAIDRYVTVSYQTVYIDGVEVKNAESVQVINYPKSDARVALEGVKTLDDANAPDNAFTFELVERDENGNVKENGLHLTEHNITMVNTENVMASRIVFDPIAYNQVGNYYYTITEVRDENASNYDPSVVYDSTVYYVAVKVTASTDDLHADVTVTTDGFGGEAVVGTETGDGTGSVLVTGLDFANEKRQPIAVKLQAQKVMEGTNEALEAFTFILRNANGVEVDRATNDGSGNITFSDLTFDNVGTYTYTIEEHVGGQDHVVYDTTVYDVEIRVTAAEDSYSANVTYNGETDIPVFTNKYYTELVLKKQDQNGNALEGAQFTLTHSGECCGKEIAAMVATSRDDGYLAFVGIPSGHEYTLTETVVPEGYNKAPDHTVKVTRGVAYVYEAGADEPVAESQHVIVNERIPDPTSAQIEATKTLEGRDLKAGEFTFELYEGEEKIGEAKNTADGKVVFNAIEYTEAGTHTYTLKEVKGILAGVTYDETAYTVTVTVTDNGEGALVAAVSYPEGGAEFKNSYIVSGVTVPIEATKTLEGRDLKAGEFTFELYEGEEKIGEAKNTADGKVVFNAIEYTEAGTHTYTLKEVKGILAGVTYDETAYTVTVTVTDNGEGALVAAVSYPEGGAEFKNSYIVSGVTVPIEATKTLEGRALKDGEFTFELYEGEEKIGEAKNTADGKVVFDAIEYTEAGTHTYTLKEVKGSLAGVTYDDTVYYFTVKVTDPGNGQLAAEIVYTDAEGNAVEDIPEMTFHNVYEPEETTEPTEPSETTEPTEPEEPDDICVPVKIHKTVVNKQGGLKSPAGFKFQVTDEDGNGVAVLTTDMLGFAGHLFKFSQEDAGKTFTYTVYELDTGEENMHYSDAVYTVRITITLDESGSRLESSVTVNSIPVMGVLLEFVNIYDEPTEPTEPSETTEPTEPSETTEPTEPSETTEPTEPSETTEPTEPSETTEPTEPSETTEPTEPSETTEPTEPSETTEPTEPSETTEPTEPSETTEPTEPSETTEPTEPSETTEPTEPSETTEPTEPSETTEPTEPSETTEPTEPSETTEPTEPSETTEPTEPSETTEPTEPSETTEPTKPSETTEPTEPSETTEPTEPSETTEPTEPSETTEPTKPSETTEPTETTKPSKNSNQPDTGDRIRLWFAVMMISGTALSGLLFVRKRKNNTIS